MADTTFLSWPKDQIPESYRPKSLMADDRTEADWADAPRPQVDYEEFKAMWLERFNEEYTSERGLEAEMECARLNI